MALNVKGTNYGLSLAAIRARARGDTFLAASKIGLFRLKFDKIGLDSSAKGAGRPTQIRRRVSV